MLLQKKLIRAFQYQIPSEHNTKQQTVGILNLQRINMLINLVQHIAIYPVIGQL